MKYEVSPSQVHLLVPSQKQPGLPVASEYASIRYENMDLYDPPP